MMLYRSSGRVQPIYLDSNGTTPVDIRVVGEIAAACTETYGNPSSSHVLGQNAKKAVDKARATVAALIRAAFADEIVFTSCATESNNLALLGVMTRPEQSRRHFVTTAIEHPAVVEVAKRLVSLGFEHTEVPVHDDGTVDLDAMAAAITDQTALVSCMLANNETGVVQPVSRVAQLARAKGALLHTDAAQAAGKIDINVFDLDCDLLTLAGHKMYAPKGIGALYVRRGVALSPIQFGANQEGGLRPGTENVPYIVGLGVAAELAKDAASPAAQQAMIALRERLFNRLRDKLGAGVVRRNGGRASSDPERGVDLVLPNTLSVALRGVRADRLLNELQSRVYASAGAACHSHDVASTSAVLRAMRVPTIDAVGTIRLSLGRFTTAREIDDAANLVVEAARRQLAATPGVADSQNT